MEKGPIIVGMVGLAIGLISVGATVGGFVNVPLGVTFIVVGGLVLLGAVWWGWGKDWWESR